MSTNLSSPPLREGKLCSAELPTFETRNGGRTVDTGDHLKPTGSVFDEVSGNIIRVGIVAGWIAVALAAAYAALRYAA
jgi:hypothetical protein